MYFCNGLSAGKSRVGSGTLNSYSCTLITFLAACFVPTENVLCYVDTACTELSAVVSLSLMETTEIERRVITAD